MECALVLALDPGGTRPRIVHAERVQADIDATVADATDASGSQNIRNRVVRALGPLRCSQNEEMVFRRRSADGARRAHFAHKAVPVDARSADGSAGSAGSVCNCGGQRGGVGHTHLRAQQLLLQHISRLRFVQWCPRSRHQLLLAGDPKWTARMERSVHNRAGKRVRVDVAVYDARQQHVLSIEVTDTHRVSWQSRDGLPYVDVHALTTVTRLERGLYTIVCEVGLAQTPCRACVKNTLYHWMWRAKCARTRTLRGRLRRWRAQVCQMVEHERANEATARSRMRSEDPREHALAARKAQEARRRHALAQLQRAEACARQQQMQQQKAREERAERALRAEHALQDRQRSEQHRKRHRTQQFMQTSRAAQRQAQQQKKSKTSARRKWESDTQRGRRYRQEHWAQLQNTRASPPYPDACRMCADTGALLCPPTRNVNDGYGYYAPCPLCVPRMRAQGWGTDTTFTEEDDRDICALLNQHGMPVNAEGTPSALHFYRSALHFYRRFRHKHWDTLARHLRHHFTTTMSLPDPTRPEYRGWYTTH